MKFKLLLVIQLLSFALFSQTPPLSRLSTTDGGSTYEVCYNNGYLYAGCANTLKIFSLNGPNHTPDSMRFKLRLLSNIDYITVHNGFLYVCANHDGLYKYNISNPIAPVQIAHYVPKNLNESVYDIGFYGDTVFVAAKTRVTMLSDSNSTFTYRGTVTTYTGTNSRVMGIDVKDSLLAYTVSYTPSNNQTGVYLHNIKNNNALLDFYHDASSNPYDVSFGQNTKLLHVMGGTYNTLLSDSGRYYALDYTNPGSMAMQFSQTIKGFLPFGAFSCPMSATIINDTVYVSTQGGVVPAYTATMTLTGQIYVFKATATNSVSLLTTVYGGLYHFDCDIDVATKTMYVASEWYGVLTVDINNLYNEISRGKTLTGGWCHGSANAKDRLVEASEGYGVRLYNTSVMQSPQLIKEDTTVGFCRAISLSDSADYVYGWFLTGNRLRVLDGNNLNYIGGINVDPGVALPADFQKSRHLGNKVAVIEDPGLGTNKFIVADVTNPAAPVVLNIRPKANANDLLFHPVTTDLITCSEDSLIVFNSTTMAKLSGVQVPAGPILQQYRSFTLLNDTLYVNYTGLGAGIAKYAYSPGSHSLTYITAGVFPMASTYRTFMANDGNLLYIGSTIDSLKAITRTIPYTKVAVYNHGADYFQDNLWGTMDLYYNKGYLFLNEYMGQTTIFGPPTSTTGIEEAVNSKQLTGHVYPNPAHDFVTIKTNGKDDCLVKIYDASGKLIYIADAFSDKVRVDISGLQPGFYFAQITSEGKTSTSKFIVE